MAFVGCYRGRDSLLILRSPEASTFYNADRMDAVQVARGPLPDFARIASGFTDLGSQFELCGNLPAIDQGGQLLRAVQGLREVVNSIDRRLRSMELRNMAR